MYCEAKKCPLYYKCSQEIDNFPYCSLKTAEEILTKIKDLADEYNEYVNNCIDHSVLDLVRDLRQLSADLEEHFKLKIK